jgi:hypothetical protein
VGQDVLGCGGGTVGTAVDLNPLGNVLPIGGAINVIPVTCKLGFVITVFIIFSIG